MLCTDLEDNDKDITALDMVLDKCLTELNLYEKVRKTCQFVEWLSWGGGRGFLLPARIFFRSPHIMIFFYKHPHLFKLL